MQSKTAQFGLALGLPTTVSASHQWVLSAMQTHGPALVTMLWRILGSEPDACDAYQETFLQLAYCENGPKPRCIRAYVFRTATNIALTMLRRRQLETRFSAEKMHSPAPLQPDCAGDLDALSLQQTLRANITQLPENLRQVIVLRDLAELPYDQVAAILGLTPATTRVYRSKALQLLSEWMSSNNHEE